MKQDADKYRLPIENLLDAFAHHKIVIDDDGNPIDYVFLEVNRAFEEMTGLKREKVIGKKVTEVLPGIEKGEFDWIAVFGRAALSGEPTRFESFSELLGRWYEVSAFSDEPGYFSAIFQDITDSKKTEQALRESGEKYLSLFEQSVAGIYLHDLEGEIIDANLEACVQLGYTKNELLELSVFDFHLQDESSLIMPKDEILNHWAKWQPGVKHVLEAQHQRKDGSIFPVQVFQPALFSTAARK